MYFSFSVFYFLFSIFYFSTTCTEVWNEITVKLIMLLVLNKRKIKWRIWMPRICLFPILLRISLVKDRMIWFAVDGSPPTTSANNSLSELRVWTWNGWVVWTTSGEAPVVQRVDNFIRHWISRYTAEQMYSNQCFWQIFHTIPFLNLTYTSTLFTNYRTIVKILHTFYLPDSDLSSG